MKKLMFLAVCTLFGFPAFAGKMVDALVICESDFIRATPYSDSRAGGLEVAIKNLNGRLNSDKVTVNAFTQDELTIEKPFYVSSPTIIRGADGARFLEVCVTLTKK